MDLRARVGGDGGGQGPTAAIARLVWGSPLFVVGQALNLRGLGMYHH